MLSELPAELAMKTVWLSSKHGSNSGWTIQKSTREFHSKQIWESILESASYLKCILMQSIYFLVL